jgi:membrane-associated phospholipid phosphatase
MSVKRRAPGAFRGKEPQGSPPFFAVRTRLQLAHVVAVVVAAAVIVVASSAVAWDGDVPGWEADVLRWINGWPDWLEPAMWLLQQVGVYMAPVVAGVIVVSFTRRWLHLVPFVLVLPSKVWIEKAVVKQLVDRQRPFVSVGPDINVRGPAFGGPSFPSGHCTTAFALGVLLTAFVPPKWRFVPITWAVIVAISRLYYGEHNLLDVVAGAALGTAFATVLWFVFLNRGAQDEVR